MSCPSAVASSDSLGPHAPIEDEFEFEDDKEGSESLRTRVLSVSKRSTNRVSIATTRQAFPYRANTVARDEAFGDRRTEASAHSIADD